MTTRNTRLTRRCFLAAPAAVLPALMQSESGAFDWDVAVDLGDHSGAQGLPEDGEGREIVRQFGVLKQHRREDIYSLCGNHDRSGLREAQNWWWRKWLDPTGENTRYSRVNAARRRVPVEGTFQRYVNEPTQKVGRDTLGGNPGGVVSGETFAWWKKMVESNRDSIIVSTHHYMLKNTTVASGEWEGMRKGPDGQWQSHYHGLKPQGTPQGASYLYWVNSVPDAQAFEKYLEAHPGAIAMWLGGHTHTNPDDTYGGKSHIESKWGVHFINVSALSKYHGRTNVPMSRLLTFSGDRVTIQCYLHTSDYAPQGWYPKAERVRKLSCNRRNIHPEGRLPRNPNSLITKGHEVSATHRHAFQADDDPARIKTKKGRPGGLPLGSERRIRS